MCYKPVQDVPQERSGILANRCLLCFRVSAMQVDQHHAALTEDSTQEEPGADMYLHMVLPNGRLVTQSASKLFGESVGCAPDRARVYAQQHG